MWIFPISHLHPTRSHSCRQPCVSTFSKSNPKDFLAVTCILRYIKGTLTHGLRYLNQSSLNLDAFCDADCAGCPTTRRSTTGFRIFFQPHCISRASKKQPTVSHSTVEAEY